MTVALLMYVLHSLTRRKLQGLDKWLDIGADWAGSVRKITRSPLVPADALAIISHDNMQLDGSGGSVSSQGGVR